MPSTSRISVDRHLHVGFAAVVIAALGVGIPRSAAAAGWDANTLQKPGRVVPAAPVEAALNLLQWPADSLPTIVVVADRPSDVSAFAEGWVRYGAEVAAMRTIFIAGWSATYREAATSRLPQYALIRLAGVLAHERTHLDHGPDENEAYAVQLLTLERLHAPLIDCASVSRSLETIRRQQHRAY